MWEKKSKQYDVVIFRTLFLYMYESLNRSLQSIYIDSIILNSFILQLIDNYPVLSKKKPLNPN